MSTIAKKNDSYLRSQPYCSPEELAKQSDRLRNFSDKLATQSAQLRRWALYMAVAGVGIVVLTVVGVFLVMRLGGPSLAPSVESPQVNQGLQETEQGKEPKTSTTPQKEKGGISAAPKGLPNLNKESKAGDSAPAKVTLAQKELFLEALGGMSAAHLYQTYLNIGLLADGVENKAYSVDEAKTTLSAITNFMDLVESKMVKLNKAGLDAEDAEALDRIKAATDLLRFQAKTLVAFWTTGAAAQADQYQQARKAAGAGLNKVLGLEAK